MIASLIKYRYAIAIIAVLGVFAAGWLYIQHLHRTISIVEAQRDQYAAESKACQDNFKINKKVSDAYFEQNLDLRQRYDANKLLLSQKCIPVSAPTGTNAAAPRGDVSGNGIDPHALHDYGRRCGENESQLKHLKGWVEETSKPRYNQ